MAQLTGTPVLFDGSTSSVDTAKRQPLGTRAIDDAGNEYIYLQGVASTAVGDWVVYDAVFATTRLSGTTAGQAAVAMAAVGASQFGWYQITGAASAKVVATGSVRVYASSVTGQALATVVTGALIHNAFTAAGNGNTVTGSVTSVAIKAPFVDAASGSY